MDKQNFFFQIVHLGSPGEKKNVQVAENCH